MIVATLDQRPLARPTMVQGSPSSMSFPTDDYTPFGYLRNPAARATSWQDSTGGLLRSTDHRPGFGWFYPHGRRPTHGAAIELALEVDGRRYQTRADFAALGLHSAHHSANVFGYDWSLGPLRGSARFFLLDPDALACLAQVEHDGPAPHRVALELIGRAWSNAAPCPGRPSAAGFLFPADGPRPEHRLTLADDSGGPTGAATARPEPASGPARAGFRWEWRLAPGARAQAAVVLLRDAPSVAQRAPLPPLRPALDARLAEDAVFWAECPRLAGDWPAHWRRGWVYDLETTRMLLFPPGGVFRDVWPAWMAHFPRAVLAEGTLDLARLAYADPATARRALLALFRDTGPNVPCVFQGGEPNMVAADGSVCGTSPAWCLPFHNVLQVYLHEPDRAWLAEIYPHLARYLEWWRRHRSDSRGWLVYRCTWESGEDDSPRLDPLRQGDHVIGRFVRPVELQAAAAYSYQVLAFFADRLGRPRDRARWIERAADYRARTLALWDDAAGRFRDWDKRRRGFVQPVGDTAYWGTDPGRYSPLALVPLLGDLATAEQRARLRAEIEHYDAPPWRDWPSWAYVVLEAATAAGWHDFAAGLAARICDRVWAENDQRDRPLSPQHLHAFGKGDEAESEGFAPLPGVAREYWPSDPTAWNGHDCYGWGAATAQLFLRQIVGFREDPETSRCVFRLAPALPADWLRPGRRFGLRGLRYRGRRFDLWYEARTAEEVGVTLAFSEPTAARIEGPGPSHRLGAATRLHFAARHLAEYRVELE